MEILKTSKPLTPQEEYLMTMGANAQKMADCVSQSIEFKVWCLYKDTNSKGEENEILAIQTPEGEVFATISATFKEDFFKMLNFFESKKVEVKAITVLGGTSKAGRPFITCTYAA